MTPPNSDWYRISWKCYECGHQFSTVTEAPPQPPIPECPACENPEGVWFETATHLDEQPKKGEA